MKRQILNIKNVKMLSKEQQKNIIGQALSSSTKCDLTLCGCDCTGSVTGPVCCNAYIACPQVYDCDQ